MADCTVSGTLYRVDNTPFGSQRRALTILEVVKTGSLYMAVPLSRDTNASGVVTFVVPQGSTAYVYADARGLNTNAAAGVALTIPSASTANLEDLVAASVIPSTGLTVKDEGTALATLIGALNFVGAGVSVAQTSAGAATVTVSAGGGGTWGSITGTLSAQTDLQAALDLKAALISPVLVTPNLGTPSAGVLTSCTGLPISSGVSGLGSGVVTFLATPSSANLISAVTGETGTGALVFADTPTLITPLLGTPTSGVLTNATGLPPTTGIVGWPANSSGVLTNNGSGVLSWAAAGGSQTPWTSAIDGDGFALSDVGDLIPRAGSSLGSAALPWLSSFTGNTTQYESVVQTAGVITHAALGSATNIDIVMTPKASGYFRTSRPYKFDDAGMEYLPASSTSGMNIGNARFSVSLGPSVPVQWTAGLASSAAVVGIVRNGADAQVQINNGTAGQWGSLFAGVRDAGTTTVTNGLTLGRQSTGTPAAGLGIALQLNLNSSTTADQNAARIRAEWTVATHAARAADLVLSTWLIGVETEVLRCKSDASTVHAGTISTIDPTTGAGPEWKLGAKKTGTLVLDAANYIEVAVAGVIYKLALIQ